MRSRLESLISYTPFDRIGGGNVDTLPVRQHQQEIKEGIAQNPTIILVADTATGKTTQAPQFMLEVFGPRSRIAVTQPRTLGAIEEAQFVAKQRGERVGESVGYIIRGEHRASPQTNIAYMTDGILLQMLQSDPLLMEQDGVMLDEAHERSENIDFAAGLLKNAQTMRQIRGLRPLKIVVSSATINSEKFSKYFDNAKVIKIEGRRYHVEAHFAQKTPQGADNLAFAASDLATQLFRETDEGNILIFMPTTRDINQTIRLIDGWRRLGAHVFPLHGGLSKTEQNLAIQESSTRKIIVATNIAETTLTPPGNPIVIDSGLIREKRYDPVTKVEYYDVVLHSKAGVDQRRGRAGRNKDGRYYALYTEDDYYARPTTTTPELLRANLSSVVLRMKAIGISDIQGFDFIDRPNPEQFTNAIDQLLHIGALSEDEHLSQTGEHMARLPLEPRIARMVVEAQTLGCAEEMSTIAAFISTGRANQFLESDSLSKECSHVSDFRQLLSIWNEFARIGNVSRFTLRYGISESLMLEVIKIRKDLFARTGVRERNEVYDVELSELTTAIVSGLRGNILYKDDSRYLSTLDDSVKNISGPGIVTAALGIESGRTVKAILTHPLAISEVQVLYPDSTTATTYTCNKAYVQKYETISFAGKNVTYENWDSWDEGAREFIATQIVQKNMNVLGMKELLATNQPVIDTVNAYSILTNGNIPLVSPETLKKAYIAKLQIREGLSYNGLDSSNLQFSPDDLIPETARTHIQEIPRHIAVGEKSLRIERLFADEQLQTITATLKIWNLRDLAELPDQPTLPEGIKAIYVLDWPGNTLRASTVNELKDKVREQLSRVRVSAAFGTGRIAVGYNEVSLGEDPFTKEPWFAHVVKGEYGWYTTFSTKEEALRFNTGEDNPTPEPKTKAIPHITWNSLRKYGLNQLNALSEGPDNINRQRALLILLHKDPDGYNTLRNKGMTDEQIMQTIQTVIDSLSDTERSQVRKGILRYCAQIYLRQPLVLDLLGGNQELQTSFVSKVEEVTTDENIEAVLTSNSNAIELKATEILESMTT